MKRSYFSQKITEEKRKKLFWKFIDELRKMKAEGVNVVTPEMLYGILKSITAPAAKDFRRRYFRIRHKYFKYFIGIAENMGFLEDGIPKGVRGWILTDKLLKKFKEH